MYSNDPLAQLASGFAGNPVRFRQKSLGATTANQQQYQVAVRGRFKLDAKGLFGINAGLYMGANFVAGFDNTGLGMGKAQSNLYLKHLYLSALPLNGVELQYGSLDFDMTSQPILRDTHITATSPANESVSNGLKSFFDDLSVAYGYVGDLNSPNAIGRLNRLEQSKFHRFMLKEDITERAWISTDYAFQAGTPNLERGDPNTRDRIAIPRHVSRRDLRSVTYSSWVWLCCLRGKGCAFKVRCRG